MELETVNKLYLELSQFATANTARELKFQNTLSEIEDIADSYSQSTPDKTAYRFAYLDAVRHIQKAYQIHLDEIKP